MKDVSLQAFAHFSGKQEAKNDNLFDYNQD